MFVDFRDINLITFLKINNGFKSKVLFKKCSHFKKRF